MTTAVQEDVQARRAGPQDAEWAIERQDPRSDASASDADPPWLIVMPRGIGLSAPPQTTPGQQRRAHRRMSDAVS